MLTIIPPELFGKTVYVDGKLTATKDLTEEEQALFDEVVRKEQETESDRFEEE